MCTSARSGIAMGVIKISFHSLQGKMDRHIFNSSCSDLKAFLAIDFLSLWQMATPEENVFSHLVVRSFVVLAYMFTVTVGCSYWWCTSKLGYSLSLSCVLGLHPRMTKCQDLYQTHIREIQVICLIVSVCPFVFPFVYRECVQSHCGVVSNQEIRSTLHSGRSSLIRFLTWGWIE